MNQEYFAKWTEVLSDIRKSRVSTVQNDIEIAGAGYGIEKFFEIVLKSIEDVLSNWWKLEQASWKSEDHADLDNDIAMVEEEMEALVDFELEATDRECNETKEKVTWRENDIAEAKSKLIEKCEDLRKNYRIKIDSLRVKSPKPNQGFDPSMVSPMPGAPTAARGGSGSGGGSGLGSFIMFLVGLIIGSGVGVYYWNEKNKAEAAYEEKIQKLEIDRKTVEDQLSVIVDTFSNLATGKVRTIPAIQKAMKPIRNRYAKERKSVESSFRSKRERLIRKIPPGDRLDASLDKLAVELDDRLGSIQFREERELKSLKKELQMLKQMMGETQG